MVFVNSLKGQNWLFPPNIQDLISDDHMCHLVDGVVDRMDLSGLEAEFDGPGHPAYPPKVMMKLLVLATVDGVRSSRRIARLARENVVYMFIAGLLKPDFRTISDFRKEHPSEIKEVFKQVVDFARSMGMVVLGHISTDGTKIKANASGSKVVTKEDITELERFIKEEFEKGLEEDMREDAVYGKTKTGSEVPSGRKAIVKKLEEQFKKADGKKKKQVSNIVEKARVEMEKSGKNVVSLTDVESRFMKTKNRFVLSYNAQITADSGHGIIIANDVTQEQADTTQLKPQLEQAKENLGVSLSGIEASADNGYYSMANLAYLAENNIDGYIPDKKLAMKKKNSGKKSVVYPKEMFEYDKNQNCFTCPQGKQLTHRHSYMDRNTLVKVYETSECIQCPARELCTKSKKNCRNIKSRGDETLRIEMYQKVRSEKGKEKYKLRKRVEPHFGDIKQNGGLREFLTRSLTSVKTEFNLACTAHNLKRIWSHMGELKNTGPPVMLLTPKLA